MMMSIAKQIEFRENSQEQILDLQQKLDAANQRNAELQAQYDQLVTASLVPQTEYERTFVRLKDQVEAAERKLRAPVVIGLLKQEAFDRLIQMADPEFCNISIADKNYICQLLLTLETVESKLAMTTQAVQAYLNGDYDQPKRYRPNHCPHGTEYYNDCAVCDLIHFQKALAQIEQQKEGNG
jgi:molecular chaperone GrpE (heat shock protein)